MHVLRQGNTPLGVVFTVDVAGIGVERHLGVDDQVLALGQVDERIGTLALAIAGGHAHFALEVDAGAQAAALQYVFQNQLAPAALGLSLSAQRATPVVASLGVLLVELFEVLQLLGQGRLLLGILVMDILDLAAKLVDLLAEGLEQRIQRLLAGLGEGLALGFEDTPGQLLELQLELLAAILEQLLLFVEMLLALVQGGLQGGVLHPQLLMNLLQLLQPLVQGAALALQLLALALLLLRLCLVALGGAPPFVALGLGIDQAYGQPVTFGVQAGHGFLQVLEPGFQAQLASQLLMQLQLLGAVLFQQMIKAILQAPLAAQ